MQTTITIDRNVTAAHVERLLLRDDLAFFKLLARDVRASRGTSDFFYQVEEMTMAAIDTSRSAKFRTLCVRFLTRLKCSAADLRPPADLAEIKIRAARGEPI